MKTTKKLLLALVALLIVSSVTMAVVFANELPVGNLSEAGALMGKIDSATTAADKVAAIEAFDAYMAEHTFPDDAISQLNYTIIVENATAAKLKFTEENIELVRSSEAYLSMLDPAKIDAAVAHLPTVEGMLENLYFDKTTDAYKTFVAECESALTGARAEFNKRVEENYSAPFGEYELPVVKKYDFEPNENGAFDKLEIKVAGVISYEYRNDGLGSQGSSGYYFEKTYSRADDPYASVSGLSAGTQVGFVFEFDYYHVPGATLSLSRGTCSINGTNSTTTEWGSFKTGTYSPGHANGVSKGAAVSGNILVENAWNHIAFAFVKETGTFYVYSNYKYLTSFKWTAPGAPVDFTPGSMRFKYICGEDAYGMRLDNMVIYYGTTPRILDRFEKMSVEERFIMSSEVVVDDTQPFEDRESAYMWMQDHLYEFYTGTDYAFGISAEAKTAVDRFLGTNYNGMKILDHMATIKNSDDHEFRLERYDDLSTFLDNQNYITAQTVDGTVKRVPNVEVIGAENTDIITAVEEFIATSRSAIEEDFLTANLDGLKTLYETFKSIDQKKLDTIATREAKIVELEGYIASVGSDKILPGVEYNAILNAIAEAKEKLVFDKAVKSLSDALNSFKNAPTIEAQIKWSGRVEGLITLEDGTSIFADLTKVDVLAELETKYKNMSVEMEKTIETDNAKKIILCTDFYKEYVANKLNEKLASETPEGETFTPWTKDSVTTAAILEFVVADYEAFLAGTKEEATDWTYVRKYCVLTQRAIQQGYQEDYAGVDMTLAFHEVIYSYYYELIQNEYLAEIETMLAKYDEAKTYVDKRGACAYIVNYIEKNGVDKERTEAAALVAKLAEIYDELNLDENGNPIEGEVSSAETEYLEALKANTTLFIEAVEGMIAAENAGYQALYDAWQAAMEYYYFMEINSDEVKEAIAKYAVYERKLIDWQTYSDLFIETVNMLNTEEASTKAGMYNILATACALKPHTNDTYEGMTEAVSLYNAKYSEYMGYANTINAEVEQTVTVAIAEREIFTVLGVIAKYFAKIFG
ncbi:MAG: hypothetical protein IKC72_04630 [Clostridia bacterium]|nr:hypothetical protein [Clostridia bacterium]